MAAKPFADDVWRMLVDLGVAGVIVPEEHGGLGLGLLEAALISEALGKHVVPVPFVGNRRDGAAGADDGGIGRAAEAHGCRSWRQVR